MKKFIKKHYLSIILGACSLIAMWLVYFIAQRIVKNEHLIPPFSKTLNSLWQILLDGFFYKSLLRTLLKVLCAFLVSFVLALILAVTGKLIKHANKFFKPILTVIRTLPTMAVILLLILFNRSTAPIIVSTLVLLPMMYQQIQTAFLGVDDGLVNAMEVYNLSKKQRLFKVYIPNIAPAIFSHVGSNLSFAIKLVISADVMAGTLIGIGGMMNFANATEDVARLFALTLVAVVLGLIVELIFHIINSFLFKWNKGEIYD